MPSFKVPGELLCKLLWLADGGTLPDAERREAGDALREILVAYRGKGRPSRFSPIVARVVCWAIEAQRDAGFSEADALQRAAETFKVSVSMLEKLYRSRPIRRAPNSLH